MRKNNLWLLLGLLLVFSFVLAACGGGAQPAAPEVPAAEEPAAEEPAAEEPAAEEPAEEVGGFQVPAIEEGKFNVAMVLIGPHDDGGWSQAHYEGLLYVQENVPNTHVAYIENVPEGAELREEKVELYRKPSQSPQVLHVRERP